MNIQQKRILRSGVAFLALFLAACDDDDDVSVIDPVDPVDPLPTAPAAPGIGEIETGIDVATGDFALFVNYTAPADDGGSEISGYTAECSSSGSAESLGGQTDDPGSAVMVSGAVPGESYECSVSAENNVGDGESSGTASIENAGFSFEIPDESAESPSIYYACDDDDLTSLPYYVEGEYPDDDSQAVYGYTDQEHTTENELVSSWNWNCYDPGDATLGAQGAVPGTSADTEQRYIVSVDRLPDHDVGDFPVEGGAAIAELPVEDVSFPLYPVLEGTVTDAGVDTGTPLDSLTYLAYAYTGVPFQAISGASCDDADGDGTVTLYDEYDDNGDLTSSADCALYNSADEWEIVPVYFNENVTSDYKEDVLGLGLDDNNASVQTETASGLDAAFGLDGMYRYHGVPEGISVLADQNLANPVMTLVGWALDGAPVYARYCHEDPMDATSDVVVCQSGWSSRENASNDTGRPSLLEYSYDDNGTTAYDTVTIPVGAFASDWEYVEGGNEDAHLDKCNGRVGVTPEFPDGIYYYVITDDYPYTMRCLNGNLFSGGEGTSDTDGDGSSDPDGDGSS